NGVYGFMWLNPSAQYAIQVVKPNGRIFTFFRVGNDRTIDNETGAPTNGTSNSFRVAAGVYLTLNSGLVDMNGRVVNTFSGPSAVPGNSRYTYTISFTGQPNVSWYIQGANNIQGDTFSTYDSATNTTLKSFDLTFSNAAPADITVNA